MSKERAKKDMADWLDTGEAKKMREEAMKAFKDAGMLYTPPDGLLVGSQVQEVDVAVIHRDFRSVADKLLEEAKLVINKAKPDKRAERYKNLGFRGIARVKEHDAAKEAKEEREELMRIINDYKVRYPTCQFLDNDSLEELCKKYGLVYAPAEYFNQEIPEENLRELEAFKLDKKDKLHESWFIKIQEKTVYTEKEASGFKMVTHTPGNNGFEVVATRDMFDVPSRFEFHGSTLRVKDPLVLKRVPRGFLIVTAWGPEAELPEVNIDKQ
jgi:hypothetical protein